jgi:GT2 family glycosyltransferase
MKSKPRAEVGRVSAATKIFHISLDEPLQALAVEDRYREVLLIVTAGHSVVGQIWLPALGTIPIDLLAQVLSSRLGGLIWRRELAETVRRAGRGPETETVEQPSIAVVVCTRDRTDQLQSCLESLAALRSRPAEVLVVDNCPSNDGTQRLCADLPVRYLLEPLPGQSRARNRGIIESTADLIAFTDDDCVVDERWLDGVGKAFADPLVMAATGYTAPLEIETRAQWLFEAHGGFPKHFERVVFDGVSRSPANSGNLVGAGANMIFRRAVFAEIGLFAEDLGPGTPARAADDAYQMYKLLAAGYRVEYDPGRIVRHRHRRDEASLRRILFDYGCSSMAYTTRLLIKHREPAALRVVGWWLAHVAAELLRSLRDPDWLPFRLALAEARGVAWGPWRLVRSKLSRRKISPLAPPTTDSAPASPRIVREQEALPLSVVVPSRNRRERLTALLDALALQGYPSDRLEVIVVLDGSEDDSGDMVRHFDAPYRLRLLEHEQVGAATSRNRGTRETSAEHVVFIDDDIVPEANFLATHAGAHQRAAGEHLALGRCPPVVEGAGWWGQALRTWWEDHYRRKGEPGHRWTFMDFDGGNASFPKRIFLSAGGFDEDFRGRREEWELGSRLLERGVHFAYYPDALARHHLDTRLETTLRHQRQHGRDDVLLAEKHPQLKPQLRLASFLQGRPAASDRLDRYGPPLVRLLEGMRLRRYWMQLVNQLLANAYLHGLEDAFPSAERFGVFVSSIWDESSDPLPLRLDRFAPPVLPRAGSMEISVSYGLIPLAGVVAVNPAEDWDWEVVTERVVGRVSDRARQMRIVDELTSAAHAPVQAAAQEETAGAH